MAEPPVQGWVDPNFPNPMGPDDAAIIIYGYTPSIVLGILGATLFFLAGLLHLWELLKYRTWYFSTIMVGIVFVRSTIDNLQLYLKVRRMFNVDC